MQMIFSTWPWRSPASYLPSVAAVFVIAIFHEWISVVQKKLLLLCKSLLPTSSSTTSSSPRHASSVTAVVDDNKPSAAATFGQPEAETSSVQISLKSMLQKRAVRAALLSVTHAFGAASGYFLMLAVMSFNGIIFLSVMAGLVCGFLLFHEF
ncbi:hypothetical protein KP509_26G072100 [Ceratopteris richardii]|nr:hypothetical protein KP509_26G072100 [Ceratopteris richardii]